MINRQTIKKIVRRLIHDIECSKGIGEAWDQIDTLTKEEIERRWGDLVENIVNDNRN